MKVEPIKLRRLNAGFLDRKEVANLLGIKESYLGKLERGDKTPSAQLIVRMAKLYRCTTDEIFEDFNITG
ncbi:MAG: Helix-turn-helix [uncultured Clostridium sp.]